MLTATEAAERGYITCLIGDHRGIYIPRDFGTFRMKCAGRPDGWEGVDSEQLGILLTGPDHDLYWDVWDEVLDSARYVDSSGNRWRLSQEGDLFVVRDDIDIDWDDWH